jgi:hypothetical protein
MITPLVNRESIDAFLFTPQLSNNVRTKLNKYAVPQQKEFILALGAIIRLSKSSAFGNASFITFN